MIIPTKAILVSFVVTFLVFTSTFSQSGWDFTNVLEYRNLGPHKAGSWISCIAVPETDNPEYRFTYYVGARNGGVWKTTNNGTTYLQIFDSTDISSIGAIAISKSHPEQIWVGTGESYSARSSHSGKGIYHSPDGGKTWECKGLKDSHHISAVIIHPENPDIVFVSSMGHLFTPNEERGIFKTVDSGKTWEKVLYIDENTGIIEMLQHPENPEILYASAYEKYRFPWHFEAGGENSGIYKSSDGGNSWTKLTNGLPEGKLGRTGIALCYEQPEILYTVIENLNPKPGIIVDENVAMTHMRDPYYDQLIGGEVYRSNDGGLNWKKQNIDSCNVSAKAAYSFNKIMIQPNNPDRITISSDAMLTSVDGGKTWLDCQWPPENYFLNMFGDIRTMWVNPKDGDHMMIGSDGGLYISYDGGINMFHHYHIPLGEIYMVEYDNAYPYNVYLGLQDHDAWKGPSNDWSGQIGAEDWNIIGMWDGMYTSVDPIDNRWVYISTQFGGHRRVDQLTGTRIDIEPKDADEDPPYRFPWTPPLVLSPHDSKTIYTGGQYLLRSQDQGDHWEEISPDLTTNDAKKIAGKGHMMYCTITTISESPLKPGLIWIGTDDGKIHITKNDGKKWTELTSKIEQVEGKKNYWVNRVLASAFDEGTAYVCKSGFKNDDFEALLFKTSDFGKTWTKITNGISNAPINVIIEDPTNQNILYAGNDDGVFVSFNKGENWQSLRLNMPVVPVKDIKIHPREKDLIVGTYGRGAYICDISLFSQLDKQGLSEEFILFDIESKPLSNYSERAYWGNYEFTGDNHLHTRNEPNALTIYTYFKDNGSNDANIIISNNSYTDTLCFTPHSGLNRSFIPTYKLKPGKYNIKLVYMGTEIEKEAIIKESPVWPVGKN